MLIPVASGSRAHSRTPVAPARRSASSASRFVSLYSSDEPAAFGCCSAMSPDRPIPCASPKWRAATSWHATRPSRSPTPALPTNVFESISASSCSSSRSVPSSQPAGIRRCDSSVFTMFSRARRACCAWRT